MLLAKSSFDGNVKNWSTLINLHSALTLEVKAAKLFISDKDLCCCCASQIFLKFLPRLVLGSLLQWDSGSVGATVRALRGWNRRGFQTLDSTPEGNVNNPVKVNQCVNTYAISYNEILFYQMKKKLVQNPPLSDEVDYNIPDYRTVINISSKDQLNITLSKCGLTMLSNLGAVR